MAPIAVVILVLFAVLRDWESFQGHLLAVGLVVLSGVCLYWVRRRIALPRVGGGGQAELQEAE
jgi:hypothetical protein